MSFVVFALQFYLPDIFPDFSRELNFANVNFRYIFREWEIFGRNLQNLRNMIYAKIN